MITRGTVTIGSDPELFVGKGGLVIGSERVIPEAGLLGRVVMDGIQLELKPVQANSTRTFVYNVAQSVKILSAHLKGFDNVEPIFSGLVNVTKDEFDSLSEKAKEFLCRPSENIYGLKKPEVDGKLYRKRAAGGHIHFGLSFPIFGEGNDQRMRMVAICDALMGSLCVLMDRNHLQRERRKLYGMAGEYRLPPHGIEYRTLSNFWLRSPILTDFVAEMAQMCVGVLHTTLMNGGEDLETQLFAGLDVQNMILAIQYNDIARARVTWEQVKPFVGKHFPPDGPINAALLPRFEKFLEKDVLEWFPGNPMNEWENVQYATTPRWRPFLESISI